MLNGQMSLNLPLAVTTEITEGSNKVLLGISVGSVNARRGASIDGTHLGSPLTQARALTSEVRRKQDHR